MKSFKKRIILLSIGLFLILGYINLLPATWSNGSNVDDVIIPENESCTKDMMKDDLYYQPSVMDLEVPLSSSPTLKERPTVGNVTILALPVYFTDQANTKTMNEVDDKWDSSGNSVKTYYLENSFNLLEITVITKAWVLAPNPISYYAVGDSDYFREKELLQFLCSYWDAEINFTQIDYIYVVYSGIDAKDGTHFWPHVWTIFSSYVEVGDDVAYDKFGYVGEFSGMGTYAHEFGHSLGLVDYYSTSTPYNCGFWELMAYGNHNDGGDHPAHMSAYSKIELDWIQENEVLIFDEGEDNIGKVNLYHLEAPNCPEGFYYAVKIPYNSYQYYLIEFRDDYGYDYYLPDDGVLLSLVDESKGSTEGRLVYIGGDHYSYELDGVELDDDEAVNSDSFIRWLTGTFELCVSAIYEFADYMEVLVDCYHDFGTDWSVYNGLPAGYELYWELTGLEAGQLILFFWDTPLALSGTDFFIRKSNGGAWTDVLGKFNIWQDALEYRVQESDDYRIVIKNNNLLFSLDVYYKGFYCTKPNNNLMNYVGPSQIFKKTGENVNFSVSIEAINYMTSWDESVSISISLSDEIALSEGEQEVKQWYIPFKNMESTFSWNLVAISDGLAGINITLNGEYSDDLVQVLFTITNDDTPPVIEFLESEPIIYTSDNNYLLQWSAGDLQSGLESFLLDNNGTLNSFDSSTTSTYLSLTTEGIYDLIIYAFDNVNNSNSDVLQVIYDITPPELLAVLSETLEVRGIYELQLELDDELSGIDHVDVYSGSQLIGHALISNSNATLSFNVDNYIISSDTSLTLRVEIYDKAGNLQVEYIELSIYSPPPQQIISSGWNFLLFALISITGIVIIVHSKIKNLN